MDDALDLSRRAAPASFRKSIDNRKLKQAHDHPILPEPGESELIRSVADFLLAGASSDSTVPYLVARIPGASAVSVRLALKLVDHERTARKGTRHQPRAKGTRELERGQSQRELYLRAAYVVNAARRLAVALDGGKSAREALEREKPYYLAHERARRLRQAAASQLAGAVEEFGPRRVGWHAHKDDLVTPECRLADGKNFDPAVPPLIGYPGMPHGGTCRCVAGAPFSGAMSVDAATRHLIVGG